MHPLLNRASMQAFVLHPLIPYCEYPRTTVQTVVESRRTYYMLAVNKRLTYDYRIYTARYIRFLSNLPMLVAPVVVLQPTGLGLRLPGPPSVRYGVLRERTQRVFLREVNSASFPK